MSDAPHLPVLAASPDWVVLAKPSGLAIHRSERVHDEVTLVGLAGRQLGRRVHPVHRLDKPASGCLLLAFDPAHLAPLAAALAAGRKTYLVAVRGSFKWDDPVSVSKPMADDRGVVREANTVLTCLGRSSDPRCSLLRAEPTTGRFHQVRRHARDLDHPVLGDHVHGDTRVNRAWRERYGLDRLHLHCLRLDLPGMLDVTCPVPDDLAAVWRQLPWWDDACAAEPRLLMG